MKTLPTSNTPLGNAVDELHDGAAFSSGRDSRDLDQAVEVPDAVVDSIEGPVGEIVSTRTDIRHTPILLWSALAAFSACLVNVWGRYATRFYAPTLLVGMLAGAGSNKGLVMRALRALQPVDKRLTEENVGHLAALRAEGTTFPDAEPMGLLLPPDISDAAAVQLMAQVSHPAFMAGTEMDSMTGSKSKEWGLNSATLRCAAEHEPISKARAGYAIRIDRPELSVLLTGTDGQVVRLIPSAEDGLFSRFTWVRVPPIPDWLSPRPGDHPVDLDQKIAEVGQTMDRLHAALAAREERLEIFLKAHHWDLFDAVFSDVKEKVREAGYGYSVDSLVHRAGVSAFRLAMLICVLSRIDEVVDQAPDTLTASDADVEAAIALALVALDHGLRLHGLLPSHRTYGGETNADVHALLLELPEGEFTRADAVDVGTALGIATRTTDKHLRTLLDAGLLQRAGHGRYVKSAEVQRAPDHDPRYDNGCF